MALFGFRTCLPYRDVRYLTKYTKHGYNFKTLVKMASHFSFCCSWNDSFMLFWLILLATFIKKNRFSDNIYLHLFNRYSYWTYFSYEKSQRTFIDHLDCSSGDTDIRNCTYSTVPQCRNNWILYVGCTGTN